jgi:hypothetical protein|nr:MAG TPA: TraT complement resistance protein [Caudoviricetes sp.]
MELNYVEMVVKAIKDKGYTITQNPYKAKLKKNYEEQMFSGSILEFEYKSFWGIKKHIIFVSDEEDSRNFHNGDSVLGANDLPNVVWFKEVYDKIIRMEGFFI